MALSVLHPVTAGWFREKFGEPTEPQKLGWPAIAKNENTLIAAPTGSGKTLSAFLVCIDRLVRTAIAGELEDECKVLYLSPLKALASDIRKNLEIPLAEIQEEAARQGFEIPLIRSQVRTGDTPANIRQQITKNPPHILVTTPESLYLMLTSERGREALRTVETVIVDEIHALARDKRGSHLTLSLQRLKALTDKKPTMIGLSATQKPVEEIASFLVGPKEKCRIFDVGHSRHLELSLIVPPSPLSTVASHEQWEEIYQLVAEEIRNHRSTLLFVNTRRLAERVAFRLAEILGEDQVLCHHGSLSKNRRLIAESMLKEGKLKAIVATASLELGIDIGYIDLVCQIGVPFSIATFLQRIGRSGHAIKATPKGKLVPLTRDELIESLALVRSVRDRQLDKIEIPEAPLDILTQQIIAECAGRGPEQSMSMEEAHQLFTGAWPYRHLSKEKFIEVVQMTADGYAPGRRKFAYLIWDRIRDRLSVRAGARLAAITSGGAIPEMGDYRVVLEDDGTMVGTVNEDFAIESLAGDIFLLGTHSWKIRHVRGSEVVVQDAHGQPPTIPFWLGEAPGRTTEFSTAVSKLREELATQIDDFQLADQQKLTTDSLELWREIPNTPFNDACDWLEKITGIDNRWAHLQATFYIALQKAAFGMIPTKEKIIFERFFDEVGGMQLVIHSPYGARVNRGWGLALRKRFCRAFDFELQASADDDGIVMSLGPQQSFPIETLFKMLNAENVEHFLVQAMLAAPMFGSRWRWNATRALAVLRNVKGKRVVPAIQRFRSEDLLTAVFPAQTACQENAPGDIEVPDHPLVNQTVTDCLNEAMDIESLKQLFRDVEQGKVELIAKDTREPSPFAYQLLNGYPYTFLDDAALEDRRTRSVSMRPALSIQELQDLDRMDPKAVRTVTLQAWPEPSTADQLYEVLMETPAFPTKFLAEFSDLAKQLVDEKRATLVLGTNDGIGFEFLVAAEAIPLVTNAYDEVTLSPRLDLPALPDAPPKDQCRQTILKGWLEIKGPVSVDEMSKLFAMKNPEVYLEAIEAGGDILRCRMSGDEKEYTHWCSRGLLRRIHRLTVEGLREQIKPVSAQDYLEFIFEEHGLNLAKPNTTGQRNTDALLSAIFNLEGFEAPALAWERELLASRLPSYESAQLDQLTSSGTVAFGRLTPKKVVPRNRGQKLNAAVPISFAFRGDWSWIAVKKGEQVQPGQLSGNAQLVWDALKQGGAQFIDEIQHQCRLLESQTENALGELAAEGLVTCDQFRAFRKMIVPNKKERPRPGRRTRGRSRMPDSLGGRWSVLRRWEMDSAREEERLESWAFLLLSRYGIVFRDLLERESLAPSWGELVRVFRRLEARGEIRGGRFIAGVSGEQFGLSETHEKLVQIREERRNGQRNDSYTVICSADPLNLVGVVTKGEKIPSRSSTRILFEAGEMTAICYGNEVVTSKKLDEERLRALRTIGSFRNAAIGRVDSNKLHRPETLRRSPDLHEDRKSSRAHTPLSSQASGDAAPTPATSNPWHRA